MNAGPVLPAEPGSGGGLSSQGNWSRLYPTLRIRSARAERASNAPRLLLGGQTQLSASSTRHKQHLQDPTRLREVLSRGETALFAPFPNLSEADYSFAPADSCDSGRGLSGYPTAARALYLLLQGGQELRVVLRSGKPLQEPLGRLRGIGRILANHRRHATDEPDLAQRLFV